MVEPSLVPGPVARPRGRCRCGHYPTSHMRTRPVAGSSNFRLEPSGPCAVCGDAVCKGYVPAGASPS